MDNKMKLEQMLYNSSKIKGVYKECAICGKLFYVHSCYLKRGRNNGKFCSKKCKGKNDSILYAIKYKDILTKKKKNDIKHKNFVEKNNNKIKNYKPCKECGNYIEKIYCNRTCYFNFRRKHMRDNDIVKVCPICKKEFSIRNGNNGEGYKKFCSQSCSSRDHIKNKKNIYQNSVGGKRKDLNNMYFRSRWEANFARYLNYLIKYNEIIKWEYETDTFVFEKIKRGTRSYLPDFKVWEKNNTVVYYEIKGYMDDKSKTKLKRMEKYYPNIKLKLIDKKIYKEIHIKFKEIIPFWEIDIKKKSQYDK